MLRKNTEQLINEFNSKYESVADRETIFLKLCEEFDSYEMVIIPVVGDILESKRTGINYTITKIIGKQNIKEPYSFTTIEAKG